jgi:hypothetical protein
MKLSGVAVAVAAIVFGITASAQQQTRGAVDWIFLIDTSKSMRGEGKGAQDIFARVQASIHTFIGQAKPNDSITIYTFDRDVRFWGHSMVGGNFDRDELNHIVQQLQANGDRTHLGLAIQTGLHRAKELLQRGDPTRERSVVLFTDGRENVAGIPNPVSIPSNIPLVPEVRPWIFFVTIGETDPQLPAFADDPQVSGRAIVVKPENPDDIAAQSERIRKIMETKATPPLPEPPPPPEPANLTLAPQSLDFGKIKPGKTSKARELTITSDQAVRVAVRLAAANGVTLEAPEAVELAAKAPAKVSLKLTAADDAAEGRRSMTIDVVAAPGETRPVADAYLSAVTTLKKPPLLIEIGKWLGILLALLILAVALISLKAGDSPAGLLHNWKQKKHLEGSIEIIEPPVADSDNSYVGLPGLGKSEAMLSAIVPAGSLDANNDARLYVRRANGQKSVMIARQSGTLRVNEIEVNETELYNDDLIELEGTKLRFHWTGRLRPSTMEDEP